MIERKIEDMCVVCNDHDKPSCGYEERGLQRKCPYNDFIERGYELAKKDTIERAIEWLKANAVDYAFTCLGKQKIQSRLWDDFKQAME